MANYDFKVVASAGDLLKAFSVRSIVFIDEQNCPYREEFDGYDLSATHFIALDGDEPVATARIRNIGGAVKFERLAVRRQYRGGGTGREFFRFVFDHIVALGTAKIIMHAQSYLTGFYEELGFVKSGEPFTEAGIEHYFMEKTLR